MSSAASIRAKLLNISRKEKIAFQLIIFRYLHERFLYRLSISRHSDFFLLKGGNLLYAIESITVRPTRDIDFLGVNVENNINKIKNIFIEICTINSKDDAVWFDTSSISAEQITEQDKYKGIRLFINSGFDTIRQRIQIDIGFGDIIIPVAQQLNYPVLLHEMQTPILLVYSIETIIAEKFHAMIELSTLNSRMKDFYDVYNLLTSANEDIQLLQEAIIATFKNRQTVYEENHDLFTNDFANNENRKKMWKAFLNKLNLDTKLEFNTVMQSITKKLKPIWDNFKMS